MVFLFILKILNKIYLIKLFHKIGRKQKVRILNVRRFVIIDN